MKRVTLFPLFLVVLFLSLFLASCAVPAENTQPPDENLPAVENQPPAATEAVNAPSAYTATDALGRTLTFETPPQRIVLTGKGLFMVADALYVFPEMGERLAATGDTGQGRSANFIPLLDPNYDAKNVLEGDAGPEQIAATQPDLVILKSYLARSLGEPLESLGIPVFYVDLETPEQYARDLAALGELLQNPERAAEVLDYFEKRLDLVTDGLAGVAEDEKPRVLMLYYSDRDGEIAFNVPPLSWIQSTIVTTAGGAPVWAEANPVDGWMKVSLEQVAAWDADVILMISYFKHVDELTAELKADPQWQALRAVQEDTLYGFPGEVYSWDQPDPRWILGQLWLAKTLYPERFADLDLQAEIFAFYRTLYNLSPETVTEQILPLLKGDL
jgi:iron complex transport system substrate-binding protein